MRRRKEAQKKKDRGAGAEEAAAEAKGDEEGVPEELTEKSISQELRAKSPMPAPPRRSFLGSSATCQTSSRTSLTQSS